MKKTRTEKGITLVALIITIIVLLILAVVAINALQNDGIIEYAKNARDDYQKAQTNESTLLGNYTNYIEENTSTVKIIKFKIEGIEEEFDAEEGMTWEEWAGNTKYNTIGCYIDGDLVYSSDGEKTLRMTNADYTTTTVEKNEQIKENQNYELLKEDSLDWT